MRLISKTPVYTCPPNASTAYEYAYYGRATGRDLVRLRFLDVSNDIFDLGSLSFSTDNGRTWPETRPHLNGRKTAEGTLRRFDGLGYVDPVKGYLLTLYLEGLFRHDDLLEGMTGYYLNYRVSADGGRTHLVDDRMIQEGDYTPEHPCDSVWVGRNGMLIPLIPPIIRTRQGRLVLCVSVTVLGPDGKYYNPGGGFTWADELIFVGRWRDDSPGRIEWECVCRLALSPDQSTRGLDENTIAEMPDGRLLLVMRASNGGTKDPDCRVPSYKWYSVSSDGGFTWTAPEPWGYSDGSVFFSSASMCQIIRHSSGRYYWLGNLSADNAKGNLPRSPLYIGEVDPTSLMLERESLFVVDDRQPGDSDSLQLSNFAAFEDREDGSLLVYMPRFMQAGDRWTGDTFVYRLTV